MEKIDGGVFKGKPSKFGHMARQIREDLLRESSPRLYPPFFMGEKPLAEPEIPEGATEVVFWLFDSEEYGSGDYGYEMPTELEYVGVIRACEMGEKNRSRLTVTWETEFAKEWWSKLNDVLIRDGWIETEQDKVVHIGLSDENTTAAVVKTAPQPMNGAGQSSASKPIAIDLSSLPVEVNSRPKLCDILRRYSHLWVDRKYKEQETRSRSGPKPKVPLTLAQQWAVKVAWQKLPNDHPQSQEGFLEDVFGRDPSNNELIVTVKNFKRWKQPSYIG